MNIFRSRLRELCLIALVVLISTADIIALNDSAPDSLITLRYKLDHGRTYTWNLVADQFIVNGRALRFSALFQMDAIDSDVQGNTQVRIRVRSSNGDNRANEIIDSAKSGLFPVGSRRTNKAGVYDAMIDELGKIITGQYRLDEQAPPPVLSGIGATNQFDLERSIDIPSMMNLMMPTISEGQEVRIGMTSIDTTYTQSAEQKISGSRGSSLADRDKGRATMDTLFRSITLDSIAIRSTGQRVCHMTVHVDRHNANGQRSESETSVVRDVHTGLLELVIERGFNLRENGDRSPTYVAVAVIETNLTRITDNQGNEIVTPPSMSPGSFR